MKNNRVYLLVFMVITFIGCTYGIRREGYQPLSNAHPELCEISVKRQAYVQPYDGKKLGRIELYDTGVTTGCSQDKAFALLRKEGCRLGANFIDLVQEQTIDLLSSCYRLKADFWYIDNPDRLDIKSNAFYLK